MPNNPEFYLQIVDNEGVVATIPGGGRLEINLVDAVAQNIVAKGVGFLRTQAQVNQAIRDGFREVLEGLKRQTVQLV